MTILLPSRVGPDDFFIGMVEDGKQLHITFTCPTLLVYLHIMHQMCLNSADLEGLNVYHPKFIGFKNF